MRHFDLGFDQFTVDHGFENVAPTWGMPDLFSRVMVTFHVPVTAMAPPLRPLRCASGNAEHVGGPGTGPGAHTVPSRSRAPGKSRSPTL
jgi:hypothetical protein